MSLESKVRDLRANLDKAPTEQFMDVIRCIVPLLASPITSEYLAAKLEKIGQTADPQERKKQCKALAPYLDWYLQGL